MGVWSCSSSSVRIFGELLVDPAAAVEAPPDPASQQSSGDGSPRNDDFPEMPDLGPGRLRTGVRYSEPFLAFGVHRAFTWLMRVRIMKISGSPRYRAALTVQSNSPV